LERIQMDTQWTTDRIRKDWKGYWGTDQKPKAALDKDKDAMETKTATPTKDDDDDDDDATVKTVE